MSDNNDDMNDDPDFDEEFSQACFSTEMFEHTLRLAGEEAVAASEQAAMSCTICFDEIELRGVLDCCAHEFCFECIVSWSKA